MPPEARRFETIAAIGREAWNACFPGELENYEYFFAIERSDIQGFTHIYYALMDEGKVLACMPAFVTEYDLATTAQGMIRSVLSGIKRVLPALMTLKLVCVGSPETESCSVGMHPDLNAVQRREAFAALMDFFERDAKAMGAHVQGLKDISQHDKARYGELLTQGGFNFIASLPVARLKVDFASIDAYLARLGSGTRKDMRRKLRSMPQVRVEHRSNIDDVLDEVIAMYHETKSRSDWQFEELTRNYFQEVLVQMGGRALCSIYYVGDKPVAANLMLLGGQRLIDKFFCMRSVEGREYNLYFLSWFCNVKLCIERGIGVYQSGQAGYETKLKLGSEIVENWIYFRHRNRLIQRLLCLISPLLAFTMPKES